MQDSFVRRVLAATGQEDYREKGVTTTPYPISNYFLTITDEPWPNRPWLAVMPTLALAT